MKLFAMIAMLVALGGPAVAHDARPAHYHAGQAQMARGLLCDSYEQAIDILRAWEADGFLAARRVYQQYARDRSVSQEGACVFMSPNLVFISALTDTSPIITKNGMPHIGMVATIEAPDGKTYYAVLWRRAADYPA